jgi:hypothetical protein
MASIKFLRVVQHLNVSAEIAALLSRSVHKVTPCLSIVWPLKVTQSFIKIWSICGMILARKGRIVRAETHPSVTLSCANPIRPWLFGIKPGPLQ